MTCYSNKTQYPEIQCNYFHFDEISSHVMFKEKLKDTVIKRVHDVIHIQP